MVELVRLDRRFSEELDGVDFVEWQLHPTFSNPIRRVANRSTNFRLDTGGWGVFMIHASVQRKDGTTEKLQHYLQLPFPYGYRETA
jgi:transcription initiation factor IIF auxiliary subunit